MIRLGVNIDHVATVRQARGESYPSPVQAAAFAELGGADNITCHLREDRRHVQDRDVFLLKETINIPLNFELAATAPMVELAVKIKPHFVTLVPERRAERTTEGGLDLTSQAAGLRTAIGQLTDAGILVSLFVEPDAAAVEQASTLGAGAVEFHTGRFCHQIDAATTTAAKKRLVADLAVAAKAAHGCGLQVHCGHGLNYGNTAWLQHIPHLEEANIGHAIVARALFVGLRAAVAEMKALLNDQTHRPFL